MPGKISAKQKEILEYIKSEASPKGVSLSAESDKGVRIFFQ